MHIYLTGFSAKEPSHERLSLLEKAEPDARPPMEASFLWRHWALQF